MSEAVELAVVDIGVFGVVVAGPAGMIEFSGMRLAPSVMCVEREMPIGTVTLGEVFAALAVVVEVASAGADAGEGD
jgi:hypothetical protein